MNPRDKTSFAADTKKHHVTDTWVAVRNIKVIADIGVYPHEIGVGQELTIHVRLRLPPVVDDRLSATVDYAEIVARASTLGLQRIALIETFARKLAEACLDDARVIEVEVEVEKPGALQNGLASVLVTLRGAVGF